jgi:hypothetical protein
MFFVCGVDPMARLWEQHNFDFSAWTEQEFPRVGGALESLSGRSGFKAPLHKRANICVALVDWRVQFLALAGFAAKRV